MGAQLSLLRYSTAWLTGSEAPLILIPLTLIKSMSDRFSRFICIQAKADASVGFYLKSPTYLCGLVVLEDHFFQALDGLHIEITGLCAPGES
ncbi:hypothetical protein Sbal183_3316 [Shewanella baltica OS183]|nr:hypothetical protein Sbal183_3316 [Shewanella baltica OS183]